MIEDAHLGEQSGLIPIETLAGHFAGLKLNDAHQGELDSSTRGRHAGKHPMHIERMRKANHELFDDMEAREKPIVAAVNGIAAGGGTEMAIASDFRIVAQSASFLLPENQLGVLPASGACSRLIQMIGIGRLTDGAPELLAAIERTERRLAGCWPTNRGMVAVLVLGHALCGAA